MFRVLRSSAGAGKTHALVKNYLGLALRTPDASAYSRILALTFTNKAATEMRERILDYLEGLSAGGDLTAQLIDVRASIMEETGAAAGEVRERAAATLSHILHHWPRLAVSTIDAFTRRVVMPFARDLQLDSELRMTTEEQFYRDLAVDRLLEEAGSDTVLTELLAAICEDLLERERDWRVDKPLRELTAQLSKEEAIIHLSRLRAFDNAHFIAVRKRLYAETSVFRSRMRNIAHHALNAVTTEGLQDEDLAHGRNGVIGFLRKLSDFDAWIEPNRNALKCRDTDKWSSAKANPTTRAAIDRIAPFLHDAVSAVEEARTDGSLQRHAIRCAVLRDLLPSAALHLLDERLATLKQEHGIAFFSDLVRKVAAIVQEEPAPFLYERLGDRYDHFLIDEFQDTSMLQWQALLPLITNALSGSESALLVGDAKQAIYRWRNGEARQFVMLPHLFGKEFMSTGDEHESIMRTAHEPIAPLDKNYRSARTIIQTNNALFDALRAKLPDEHRAVFEAQAQGEVSGAIGYVHLHCYAPAERGTEEDVEDVAAGPQFVAEAVSQSLADGFRPGDVAVLVRTKNQGRAIAEHLLTLGYQVVSPDGLSLGSDPAVRAVMALFAWLHRPEDSSAAQAVQYIALAHGSGAPVDPFEQGDARSIMLTWAQTHPHVNTRSPLLTLLHSICEALGFDPTRDAFVLGLLNEAHTFVQEHGDTPLAFLDHWTRVAAKRSVGGADNDQAVRVMTVHASKGLQFPVVIVPWADMSTRGPRDRIWIDPQELVPDLPAALIRPDKTLDGMGIPELSIENGLAQLDLMDLLYVAFTRPEQRLYAGVDGRAKQGIAAWLREHFALEPGSMAVFGERSAATVRRTNDPSTAYTLKPTLPHARVDLAIRLDAPADWDPADPDPLRSHGKATHAVLARVRTPHDLPEALAVEAAAWGLSGPEKDRLADRLSRLLAQPELQPFFGDGLRVRTEVTMIDGLGHAFRPDRICSDALGTRVLDIKTGGPRPAHADQVNGYAHLLRELGETNVSAHLLYIQEAAESHTPGLLVDLAP